ncbi:MAG: hypothetical protein IJ127_06930 [Afipia sp.]|uniref:DUF5681 domain-containing protein n=1 Tax=Candidatus Afipia apatlaquensis TaxID=2712852 RepID=A0A7C9VLM3_9BRAD|nr:hypothetical protein [Afipia sp.]MBQ8102622.1 hypothetical protein [Afipia sp.]NGX99289.1 hypothetical protein [Candidatus Afipia apatlaquensis]
MSEQEDDSVGYRKPPAKTRFQPGQSGNPNGRPKGSVNLKTDLRSELSERIRIREGERSLKVSKQRAMLKALVAKALKGDARAANVVLTLVGKLFEPEVAAEQVPSLTSDDQAILERFLARRITEQEPKI